MARSGHLLIALSALLASSCSDGAQSKPAQTVPFPTASDSWSSGKPGVLGVRDTIVAERNVVVPALHVDVKLRFAKPLACPPNISVTSEFGGFGVVTALLPGAGETEASGRMTFHRTFAGTARLLVKLMESQCGPLEISLTDSTVTFASQAPT